MPVDKDECPRESIRTRLVCKHEDFQTHKPCNGDLLRLHVNGTAVLEVVCPKCKKASVFRWGTEGIDRIVP